MKISFFFRPYLPGLVMIISVPISWKVFQSSRSSRVILMLPCRYASGPAAMEAGGAPLKLDFSSAESNIEFLIRDEVRKILLI